MRAVLILFAWFALAAPALAQTEPDFYLLSMGGSREAPTDVALADVTRVTDSEDGYRRIWTWTYFTPESSADVRSVVVVADFDCAQSRYRIMQITGREWSGEAEAPFTPDDRWAPVTPDSNASILREFSCSTTEAISGGRFARLGNVDPDTTAAGILHLEQDASN